MNTDGVTDFMAQFNAAADAVAELLHVSSGTTLVNFIAAVGSILFAATLVFGTPFASTKIRWFREDRAHRQDA